MTKVYTIFTFLLAIPIWVCNAQEGEHVRDVQVLTIKGDTITLPYFGEKNLLLFYADPSKPNQNSDVRSYFQEHPIDNPMVASYGVINLAAAPLIPNNMIIKMATKAMGDSDGSFYLDPHHYISNAWNLSGANQNFTIIAVGKDQVIDFYKAGQLSTSDKTDLFAVLSKYESE